MDQAQHRGPWRLAAIAATTLAVTLTIAAQAALTAMDHRQRVEGAMALQHAAAEVSHADQVRILTGQVPTAQVLPWVEVLQGDHALALQSLEPTQAARALVLIEQIANCGVMLVTGVDGTHPEAHNHDELRTLLGSATERAVSDAARAERAAGFALAGAGLALAGAGWLALRARHRLTQARSGAEAMRHQTQRLHTLLDSSPDSLFVITVSGSIAYRSAASDRLVDPTAASVDDLVERASAGQRAEFRAFLLGAGATTEPSIFQLTRADGSPGWFEVRTLDLTADRVVGGHLFMTRDITTEMDLRQGLEAQANTDALTGLPNRRILPRCLERARTQIGATGDPAAVLALDIDGFKAVNDALGHPMGDVLLANVAARLASAQTAEVDLVRLGGDEFAVVIPSVPGAAAALLAARTLAEVLIEPFRLGPRLEHVRASVGVAVASDPAEVDDLLHRADVALRQAKQGGGDSVILYEAAMEAATSRKSQISRALREADHDTELHLRYQPIVAADTGRITGLEALLRWDSPSLGQVSPEEFIPIAEVSGEICRIGLWVVDQICHQLAVWIEAGIDPDITVSFNVSARQLGETQFVANVLEAAHRWAVPTNRLVAEITETAALDHTGRSHQRIGQLREAGLRISIDDFGAGYSNLGQLLSVPFDVIKIDRSLLLTLTTMREHAGGDPTDSCAIMGAIVTIASILEVPVVCEGVESDQQLASLQASGITHIQGFLTGPPCLPHDLLPRLLPADPVGSVGSADPVGSVGSEAR